MENNYTVPLVSVIIPSYNHDKYIIACLNSIIKDDYPHKEIIVLDDGSTDNSVNIVKQWYETQKGRIEYSFKFIHRENRGLTKTLNELVSYSKGKYCCIIASDDYLLPGGIRKRIEYMGMHPSKKAVFGDYVIVDENGDKLSDSVIETKGRKRFLADDKLIASELIFSWSLAGPILMVEREAYEVVGGYDERLVIEDWDFYLKLAAKNLIGFVNFPVAAYRVHGKNTCNIPGVWSKRHDSMYLSIVNNLSNFKGLNKWNLFARKLIFQAKLLHREGKSVRGFLYVNLGRILNYVTKWIYKIRSAWL